MSSANTSDNEDAIDTAAAAPNHLPNNNIETTAAPPVASSAAAPPTPQPPPPPQTPTIATTSEKQSIECPIEMAKPLTASPIKSFENPSTEPPPAAPAQTISTETKPPDDEGQASENVPTTENKTPTKDLMSPQNVVGVVAVEKAPKLVEPKSNETEDSETIDNIAAMIARTSRTADETAVPKMKPVTISLVPVAMTAVGRQHLSADENGCATDVKPVSPPQTKSTSAAKTKVRSSPTKSEKKVSNKKDNNSSYEEEVEYKLEEMFAGIDDDRPISELTKKLHVQNGGGGNGETVSLQMSGGAKKKASRSSSAAAIATSSPKLGGAKKKLLKRGGKNSQKSTGKKKGRAGKGGALDNSAKKSSAKNESTLVGGAAVVTAAAYQSQQQQQQSMTVPALKGPFVHVTADGASTVINAPITEEIADTKSKIKKGFTNQTNNDRSKIRGLHVSTLSMKYDADTTDKTWMCVFCKMGPHRYGLGDLFGPYIVRTTCEEFQLSQVDPCDDVFAVKRSRADMQMKRPATGGQPIASGSGTVNIAISD